MTDETSVVKEEEEEKTKEIKRLFDRCSNNTSCVVHIRSDCVKRLRMLHVTCSMAMHFRAVCRALLLTEGSNHFLFVRFERESNGETVFVFPNRQLLY